MSFPEYRPRRLRRTPAVRRLARETHLVPSQLVLPMFVREGITEPSPIGSMPGIVQHSLDSLRRAVAQAAEERIGGVMLFGVPETRDAVGSGADDPNGILNVATEAVVAEAGDALVVQTDLCLDEFTDHGHCGVLREDGAVDNDATLERYTAMGLASETTDGGGAAQAPRAVLGKAHEVDSSECRGKRATASMRESTVWVSATTSTLRPARLASLAVRGPMAAMTVDAGISGN